MRTFDPNNLTITIGDTKIMRHEIGHGLVITEIRIWPTTIEGRLKARVSITLNDAIRINPCRLIEGRRGLFLSAPSEKKPGTDQWFVFVHFVTEDVRDVITKLVVETYTQMLSAAGPTR